MISVADNFSYLGTKPLDNRLKYDTVASMKAVADATMYDGCLAYCTATDKTYQWKSTNTVDETLGKWREFSSGGGGGASALNDLSDVTLTDPANGQVLKNNGSGWVNSALAKADVGLGNVANTADDATPTQSGTKKFTTGGAYTEFLARDKDIEKYCTSSTAAATAAKTASFANSTISTTIATGMKVRVKFTYANTAASPTLKIGSMTAKNIKVIDETGAVVTPTKFWNAGDIVVFTYDGTQWLMDNALRLPDIMPSTDMSEILTPLPGATPRWMTYSTEEQAVGTWIDGKTIYQKVISGTTASSAESYYSVALDVSIDTAFVISFAIKNGSNTWMFLDPTDTGRTVSITTNAHSSSPNKFAIRTSNTLSRPFIAIIQYTKV